MANEVLFIGGLLNFVDPLFGWQLYIWGWVVFLVFAVISYLLWRYVVWTNYKPMWGHYDSYKAISGSAFIFNLSLVCELLSERAAKCIFDYSKWIYEDDNPIPVIGRIRGLLFNYAIVFLPELTYAQAVLYKLGRRNMDVEIAKRLQNNEWESSPSVNIDGIPTDMILDAGRWTVPDSPEHKTIVSFCESWNETNPNDQIHSYSKFQRYLLEKRINPPPEGINPAVLIPWIRIDSTFPINQGDTTTLGAVRQLAFDMETEEANQFSRYYMPVLFGSFGFAVLLLVIRVLSHKPVA